MDKEKEQIANEELDRVKRRLNGVHEYYRQGYYEGYLAGMDAASRFYQHLMTPLRLELKNNQLVIIEKETPDAPTVRLPTPNAG